MIYQISYQTDKYNHFFEANNEITKKIHHRVLRDEHINLFLKEFGYYEWFKSLKIHPTRKYAEKAILCDVIRLLYLYEFGGVYVDADVIFSENVIKLEKCLRIKYGERNISLVNNSLFFIRGIKHSPYLNHLINCYRKATYLYLDVEMLKNRNLVEYKDEVTIISKDFLKTFFTHEQLTTK